MSNLATLARPYAKAAFDLASGQGDLTGWNCALVAASVAAGDDAMATWLQSPDVDREKAVRIISEASGGDNEIFTRFLGVLAANDRLSLLPEVTGLFGRLKEESENQMNVRVVSAVSLDEEQAQRLGDALAKRFDCAVELHNEVDADVLGGAIIYAGDQVIDGSLKGRLARLENSLA